MNDPTTKTEALTLASTMDARGALAREWAAQYRAQRRARIAKQMDDLALRFDADAVELRRIAPTLPESP